MSQEILIEFKNGVATNFDPTRIGIVAGGSGDGMKVVVEPDIDGWDGVRPEVACEILRSGMAACGVWAEVSEHSPGEGRVSKDLLR